MKQIDKVQKQDGLGLKIATWQQATGFLGGMAMGVTAILYFAMFIIIVAAIVVILSALLMATLRRSTEIGTMRAIGAQRGFVLRMILAETLGITICFGGLGAALGALFIWIVGRVGYGATSDFAYFFFAGPRFFPHMGVGNIVAALVIILIGTSIATLYPAILATRVSPVQAMQTED
jgi:ABC-type lipoprotein release transport system permease subunit